MIFLKNGGATDLDLTDATGTFPVKWHDPHQGGELQDSTVRQIAVGGTRALSLPPDSADNDWVILVRKTKD